MSLELFFGLLFGLMIMQVVGARRQVKEYKAAVRRLHQRGNIGIGGRRGRFGPGCIVILACSGDGTITGAERMKGMTIFSRFQEESSLYGRTIYELKQEYESLPPKRRKYYQPYEQAADALIGHLQKEYKQHLTDDGK